MNTRQRPRVLLIGPRPRPGEPIGGTQVSFSELCENFERSGTFELDVVDTTRPHAYTRGWRRKLSDAFGFAATLVALLQRGKRADVVMFNASSGGIAAAGPWIARVCRQLDRPLVLRVFGGALDLELERATPSKRRRLLDALSSAKLVLLQTEHLCAHFRGAAKLEKLPTTRRLERAPRPRGPRCERFLFLSQLRPEKGLDDALRAIELCPPQCTLDVYGPSLPTTDLLALRNHPRAVYHGALPHEHVARVLAEHDALVFPSTYEGEGLPGIVVEALQAGLPVIATRWRALPELVSDEQSGLLVPPRSPIALAAAMARLSLDETLFADLRVGAAERGRELDASNWQRRLEGWLLNVCGRTADRVNAASNYREVSP